MIQKEWFEYIWVNDLWKCWRKSSDVLNNIFNSSSEIYSADNRHTFHRTNEIVFLGKITRFWAQLNRIVRRNDRFKTDSRTIS